MAELPSEKVQHILDVMDEVRYGSGCLAQELESFADHVDRDAGITSVAFDRTRHLHGDPFKCHKCGYALASLNLVKPNIARGPTHGGLTRLYPMEAYRLQRISDGDCERNLIEPLETRLNTLGLLEDATEKSA